MESLLANFDIEKKPNFWKLYPTWKTPGVFKEFYTKDKSKGKANSSLIMWAVVHMFDKTEHNPYRTLEQTEKIEVINDDVLDDHGFNWDKYKEIVDLGEKVLIDEIERMYYAIVQYFESRRLFIEEEQEDLNFEKIKAVDDVIKRNADIMKERDRLKDLVEQKQGSGKVKGDRIESAREQGLF